MQTNRPAITVTFENGTKYHFPLDKKAGYDYIVEYEAASMFGGNWKEHAIPGDHYLDAMRYIMAGFTDGHYTKQREPQPPSDERINAFRDAFTKGRGQQAPPLQPEPTGRTSGVKLTDMKGEGDNPVWRQFLAEAQKGMTWIDDVNEVTPEARDVLLNRKSATPYADAYKALRSNTPMRTDRMPLPTDPKPKRKTKRKGNGR